MTKARKYMGFVKMLPCAVCGRHPVDAHHVICGRFSQKKTPDWHVIPLCDTHHQGLWSTSGPAIHKGKKTWVKAFGPDTDYIAGTQAAVKSEFGLDVPDEYKE